MLVWRVEGDKLFSGKKKLLFWYGRGHSYSLLEVSLKLKRGRITRVYSELKDAGKLRQLCM